MTKRHELILPDLGMNGTPLTVSLWLIAPGARVNAGDRVVEILAGSATVDLSAPASGRLTQRFVQEDDPVCPGQVLAVIEERA